MISTKAQIAQFQTENPRLYDALIQFYIEFDTLRNSYNTIRYNTELKYWEYTVDSGINYTPLPLNFIRDLLGALNIGVGNYGALYTLHASGTDDTPIEIALEQNGETKTLQGQVSFNRSQGVFEQKNAITGSTNLGRLVWRIFDGTNYVEVGSLGMATDGSGNYYLTNFTKTLFQPITPPTYNTVSIYTKFGQLYYMDSNGVEYTIGTHLDTRYNIIAEERAETWLDPEFRVGTRISDSPDSLRAGER